MTLLNLTDIIMKNGGGSRAGAAALAWRILNEYRDDFRAAALELAQGGLPGIQVNGLGLQDVEKISGIKAFEALELLRIISQDSAAGMELLFRLGRSDRVVR